MSTSSEGRTVAAVDQLSEALRTAGVEVGYVGGANFRRIVAERLLLSPWLAAHDAKVRADAIRDHIRSERAALAAYSRKPDMPTDDL